MGGAHESMEHSEHAQHASGTNRSVALLIAVIALFLAFSETLGKSAQTEALARNVEASNLWSFFQAKAIRATTLRTASEQMETQAASSQDAGAREAAEKRVRAVLGTQVASMIGALSDDPARTQVRAILVASQLLGMALTVGGVAWALGDRRAPRVTTPEDRGSLVAGVLLGLGGALGQAAGLVLSKHGMGDYDPMAATQIRVLAGTLGFALIFTLGGWWSRVGVALRQPRPMAATAAGAVFGPFLGVTLSLVAVQHATAGVAASIMSTSPILVIPIVVLWKRERVGLGSVLGTIVAVIGVIVLVR